MQILSGLQIPNNATVYLVTLDVASLYTNIPHDDGIKATSDLYANHHGNETPAVPTSVLTTLLRSVLVNNVFEFNSEYFIQLNGTSMGTKLAPNYANLFMANLEESFLADFEQRTSLKPLIYLRDFSPSTIHFLDVNIHLDNNNKIKTSLYTKPTDNPSYLHFTSEHPRHMKTSLPYSMALRCSRICSDINDAQTEIVKLEQKFLARGYPKELVRNAPQKAIAKRSAPIDPTNSTPGKPGPINFITTYNSNLPNLNSILKRHHSILLSNERTKLIFDQAPRIVYRRPRNLRDHLVRAKVNSSQSHRLVDSCQPCGKPRCLVCRQMTITKQVQNIDSSFVFEIRGSYNCQTSNAVYLLQCTLCKMQYIGQTSTQFNYRFNNHKSHCTIYPDLSISKHCAQEGHNLSQFSIAILKAGFGSLADRLYFESYMIQRFKTKTRGLNEDYGILPPLLD